MTLTRVVVWPDGRKEEVGGATPPKALPAPNPALPRPNPTDNSNEAA
jgi:hypothetical protein